MRDLRRLFIDLWRAGLKPRWVPPPPLDLNDDELVRRIRRQLDAKALQLYQDTDRRNRWMTPVDRWSDREEAAIAIAVELKQFGARRVRWIGTQTEYLCDHRGDQPHRDNWQGCRQPVEVHVYEVRR